MSSQFRKEFFNTIYSPKRRPLYETQRLFNSKMSSNDRNANVATAVASQGEKRDLKTDPIDTVLTKLLR